MTYSTTDDRCTHTCPTCGARWDCERPPEACGYFKLEVCEGCIVAALRPDEREIVMRACDL
jgi:hypothetical protein